MEGESGIPPGLPPKQASKQAREKALSADGTRRCYLEGDGNRWLLAGRKRSKGRKQIKTPFRAHICPVKRHREREAMNK